MKLVTILTVLLIVFSIAFSSCRSQRSCPYAYEPNDVEEKVADMEDVLVF